MKWTDTTRQPPAVPEVSPTAREWARARLTVPRLRRTTETRYFCEPPADVWGEPLHFTVVLDGEHAPRTLLDACTRAGPVHDETWLRDLLDEP